MDELQRIKDDLLRLGLHQTLECFTKETCSQPSGNQPSFLTEAIPEVESPLSQSPPRIETSLSEPCLAPLMIAKPVCSETTQTLFPNRSVDSTKSPKRQRKASPHFIVTPVHDQLRFRMHEISNKTLSEKSNYDE